MEPDCRMQDSLAWLYELLRNANGGAAAGDGHGEILRYHAKIWATCCLDRQGQLRPQGARCTASLEEAATYLCEFNVRPISRQSRPCLHRQVWDVMERGHWHTFQILTKRPERMLSVLSSPVSDVAERVAWDSVESAISETDRCSSPRSRTRPLVSFEPLLGPIVNPDLTGIHWAIVGGESGPAARTMDQGWAEALRDTCERQRVAFFFKQWGGKRKKKAGRTLAGRTWDEYPARVQS